MRYHGNGWIENINVDEKGTEVDKPMRESWSNICAEMSLSGEISMYKVSSQSEPWILASIELPN